MLRRDITITHPVLVNDGKPFEALTVKEVVMQNGTGYMIDTPTGFFLLNEGTREQVDLGRASITFQLAQALNPTIKVTQAVLEAMEKVPSAKFYVGEYGSSCETKYPLKRSDETYYTIHNARQDDLFGTKLQLGDYIQADCPLALQVLLGFTTEGVPVNA
jgi:hypothetical protein